MEYFGIAIPMIIIGIIYCSCEMISNHRDKYYADVCKEFTLIMSSLDSDEKEIMYDVSHYASTCRFKKTPVHEFKDDMIDLLDFYKKNEVASDDLIVIIIEIVFWGKALKRANVRVLNCNNCWRESLDYDIFGLEGLH